MELTTQQFAILLGITIAQLGAVALPYWIGRTSGLTSGRATGYQNGYDAAVAQLMPEHRELKDRCRSAERLLAGAQADLRHARDDHAKARSHAAETIEELTTRLDDAQVLNDDHATLLRQSANKFVHIAGQMQLIHLTDDARHAMTLADQLRNLAGWLKPQTQPQHMERAA
jgi:hypothetical protein